MEPCLAQFTILSIVERTYSIKLRSDEEAKMNPASLTRTSLVLRCLQAQLVRADLGNMSDWLGGGSARRSGYLRVGLLRGVY